MLIQLALTLMMPLLLCIGICWWLCETFSIGLWIYLPGILFGLGSSAMSAYKFYLTVMKQQDRRRGKKDKDSPKRPAAFNDHI
ncbi:MAG: AtpZ/AtpI family protein [Lachnospiraceae bacterium]|nr:AtpZ/AtpI family protein [Lachnospiraceae bacterium]